MKGKRERKRTSERQRPQARLCASHLALGRSRQLGKRSRRHAAPLVLDGRRRQLARLGARATSGSRPRRRPRRAVLGERVDPRDVVLAHVAAAVLLHGSKDVVERRRRRDRHARLLVRRSDVRPRLVELVHADLVVDDAEERVARASTVARARRAERRRAGDLECDRAVLRDGLAEVLAGESRVEGRVGGRGRDDRVE